MDKNGWFGMSEKERLEKLDEVSIKVYGKKVDDLAKPMPDLTDKQFRALQDRARKYR